VESAVFLWSAPPRATLSLATPQPNTLELTYSVILWGRRKKRRYRRTVLVAKLQ